MGETQWRASFWDDLVAATAKCLAWLHQERHKARLKAHKDGRLVMQITRRPSEKNKVLKGWISKPDKWIKMFDVLTDTKKAAITTRRLITNKELDSKPAPKLAQKLAQKLAPRPMALGVKTRHCLS